MNFLQKCQKIDAFGVPLTLRLKDKQATYQSSLGGVVTLLIYSLSLCYGSWVFYQWQQNQLSPKTSSSQYITDFNLIDFNYTILNVQFLSYSEQEIINPFDPEQCILLPLLFQVSNINGSIMYQSLLNSSVWDTENRNTTSLYSIQLNSGINLYEGNGQSRAEYDQTIVFARCNPNFLTEGQQCASEERIQQFFGQKSPFLQISLTTKVFDSHNKLVDNKLSYYVSLEDSLLYNLNLGLKSTRFDVKDDLFTTASRSSESITGAQTFGQTNTLSYSMNTYGLPVYATIYIQLQAFQTLTVIEYQHIGELLAQIGSILSILFMTKYIIAEVNHRLLWNNIYDDIISYYYPEYKSIQVIRSITGKVNSVRLSGQVLDPKEYEQYVKKLRMKVEHKLTLNNLLYEISRMQLYLRSMYPLKDLQQTHHLGIKFRITNQLLSERQLNESEDETVLNDDDLDCLSLDARNRYNVKQVTSLIQPYFTNICQSNI